MSTVTPTPHPETGTAPARPRLSVGRGAALAGTTFLTCALPTVWGVNTVVQLLTGTESDHLFHQLTGQGLVLSALWLAGLVPLVVAGWRRRSPSPDAAVQHTGFVLAALLAGVAAPQNGALSVAVIALCGALLLWWALPAPVRWRVPGAGLDPFAAPLALLGSALLVPYAIMTVGMQHHDHNEHAEMAHYFDMAWISMAAIALMLAGAALGRLRLLVTGGGVLAAIGAAGLAVPAASDAPSTLWCAGALAIAAASVALAVWRRRR